MQQLQGMSPPEDTAVVPMQHGVAFEGLGPEPSVLGSLPAGTDAQKFLVQPSSITGLLGR